MFVLKLQRVVGRRPFPLRGSQFLNYSSDKKFSDDKVNEDRKKNEEKEKKRNSATERLNKLLASMQKDEGLTSIKQIEVTKAGGKKHRQEKRKESKQQDEKKPKDVVEAVKGVAELMGDKAKQTESELLSKLLGHIDGSSTALADKQGNGEGNELSLRDVIVGMKIDRTRPSQAAGSRGDYVRSVMQDRQKGQRPPRRPKADRSSKEPHPSTGSVNLFGEEPLGIFKNKDELVPSPDILKTWQYLNEKELKLRVTHPPANYFEKMTLWTEQGKLWKFPIDNEQGLDQEAKVDFSEHVFMEQHLEGWCPNKGPVRHFMELVCVGLSKNPYLTAQEKKDHILWYRDYFESKKELLQDLIVQKEETKEKTKRVESS